MATGGRQVKTIVARRLRAITLICFAWMISIDVHANTTYRVGNSVLTVGDDASRVQALLGKPLGVSRGSHVGGRLAGHDAKRRHRGGRDRKGPRRYQATRWHYRVDGRAVVVTLVGGMVADISTGR